MVISSCGWRCLGAALILWGLAVAGRIGSAVCCSLPGGCSRFPLLSMPEPTLATGTSVLHAVMCFMAFHGVLCFPPFDGTKTHEECCLLAGASRFPLLSLPEPTLATGTAVLHAEMCLMAFHVVLCLMPLIALDARAVLCAVVCLMAVHASLFALLASVNTGCRAPALAVLLAVVYAAHVYIGISCLYGLLCLRQHWPLIDAGHAGGRPAQLINQHITCGSVCAC